MWTCSSRAIATDARLHLDVFGAGPEEERLRTLARSLDLADRAVFHGHVDEADIPAVYRHVDVLAVPSVPMPGWVEQFGRVVVEAQASGVPVVASTSGALPDVIGDSGLLVPPRDPDALRTALVRLLEEPGLWERLHEAGPVDAARCSWSEVADAQMALYRAVTTPGADRSGDSTDEG